MDMSISLVSKKKIKVFNIKPEDVKGLQLFQGATTSELFDEIFLDTLRFYNDVLSKY